MAAKKKAAPAKGPASRASTDNVIEEILKVLGKSALGHTAIADKLGGKYTKHQMLRALKVGRESGKLVMDGPRSAATYRKA